MNRLEASPLPSKRMVAAIAVGALALGGIGDRLLSNLPGSPGPLVVYAPQHPVKPHIDEYETVVTWNMHNEVMSHTGDIKRMKHTLHPDHIMLQEVNKHDAEDLAKAFPRDYIVYKEADTKQKGGYGNLIMSRQKPENIQSLSMSGTSLTSTMGRTVKGLGLDLAHDARHLDLSQENTHNALQENRAILAVTGKIRVGDHLKDFRLMTGHIAWQNPVHDRQLKQTVNYVQHNTRPGTLTVFCGDLNSYPDQISKAFGKIGFDVTVTGHTSLGSDHKTLDYCVNNPAGLPAGASVRALYKWGETDHFPVELTLRTTESEALPPAV